MTRKIKTLVHLFFFQENLNFLHFLLSQHLLYTNKIIIVKVLMLDYL